MKLLLTNENVIFDFDNNIIYAKIEKGVGFVECQKEEATHILNKDKNSAVMANQGFTLIEVDSIPDEIQVDKYKYENGKFIINENYTPYISTEARISALEDMVNMLLLGGQL